MILKKIDEIVLYEDLLGQSVKTPVLQVGSGSPHVVMTALQHGWELIGLDTALQVLANKEMEVNGTITLISVLNPSGFMSRSRFAGDNMGVYSTQTINLNRVHPGNKKGKMAE